MGDNNLINIGDELIFQLNYPITHIEEIVKPDLTGIVPSNKQSKYSIYFTYSNDLLYYSDWIPLTTTNLKSIPIKPEYDLDMKFKVVKTSDDNYPISVNYVSIEVKFKKVESILKDTIFQVLDKEDYEFYSNWCRNVLRKLYEPGIVPIFLERGDSITDRDYIDFWRAVSCYWGLFVVYARRFESLEKVDILKRLLDSKQINYHKNLSVNELKVEVESTFQTFSRRGTFNSLFFIDEQTLRQEYTNGEYQGLINREKDACGEIFHFSPSRFNSQGLVLNRNSYLSRYIYDQKELSLFNIQSQNIYFINCIKNLTLNTIDLTSSSSIETPKLPINSKLDYELVFLVKSSSTVPKINVDFKCYNAAGLEIGFNQIPELDISVARTGQYLLARVIIFAHNSSYIQETSLNLGRNGRMPIGACKLSFRLSTTGSMTLKDFDFKILNTQYQKASIQGTEIIDLFIKDKSEKDNSFEIINEFLVNQDKVVFINNLE